MPLEVVDRVHALARHGFANQTLTFANRDRFKADEDDNDESYHPSDDDYSNGDENHAVNNPIHDESDEVAGVNENNTVDGNDIINQMKMKVKPK